MHFISRWDHNVRSIPDLLYSAIYDQFFNNELETDFIDLTLEVIEDLVNCYQHKFRAQGANATARYS
jgi:hypothetical protein